MSTRIKYEFTGPIGISRQLYTVNRQTVRLAVNKEDFTYEIVALDGTVLYKSGGKTRNYNVLLRQAKRALINFGYTFHDEKRDRDYGVITKEV